MSDAAQAARNNYYMVPPLVYHGYAIGIQKAREVLPELRTLHVAHWDETETGYVAGDMHVDYESFLRMEAKAQLVLFTVRDSDGTAVGNLVYALGYSMHQKGKVIAEERAFFIDKEHRKGGLALRLLQYAEDALRELGVNCMTMSDKSPAGGVSVEPLVRRRGYKPASLTYVKELEV